MSEYLTDEEQMNRFNDWWKEHGTSLLIAVGVTVAGIVGWNVYSDQRQQTIEAGTAVYAEYVDATDADEKQILAQRIKTEFAGSSFQVLVALTEAKKAVDTGNLTMAAQALRSAGDAASDALLADLASLRLARVNTRWEGRCGSTVATRYPQRRLSVIGTGVDWRHLSGSRQDRTSLRGVHQRAGQFG